MIDSIIIVPIGFITSYIFFLIVVYIPMLSNKERMKKNLRVSLNEFKEYIIRILLEAAGDHHSREIKDLFEIEQFREFFEKDNRWFNVANGLSDRSMSQIIRRFELLREDILFALNNTEINSDEVFEFLKRTDKLLAHYSIIEPNTDDPKFLLSFLWQVFAGWSLISGYSEIDVFEEMIRKM